MNVRQAAELLQGVLRAGDPGEAQEIRGGYMSDLLSDVMANAEEGDVWITLHKHVSIIAVAKLKGLAAVVIVNGRQPEADTIARAQSEGVSVISTPLPAFEAAGILHSAGVPERRIP